MATLIVKNRLVCSLLTTLAIYVVPSVARAQQPPRGASAHAGGRRRRPTIAEGKCRRARGYRRPTASL